MYSHTQAFQDPKSIFLKPIRYYWWFLCNLNPALYCQLGMVCPWVPLLDFRWLSLSPSLEGLIEDLRQNYAHHFHLAYLHPTDPTAPRPNFNHARLYHSHSQISDSFPFAQKERPEIQLVYPNWLESLLFHPPQADSGRKDQFTSAASLSFSSMDWCHPVMRRTGKGSNHSALRNILAYNLFWVAEPLASIGYCIVSCCRLSTKGSNDLKENGRKCTRTEGLDRLLQQIQWLTEIMFCNVWGISVWDLESLDNMYCRKPWSCQESQNTHHDPEACLSSARIYQPLLCRLDN